MATSSGIRAGKAFVEVGMKDKLTGSRLARMAYNASRGGKLMDFLVFLI